MEHSIDQFVSHFAEHFQPQQVILFSKKQSISGQVTGFKLCIVMNTEDKLQTEREIYLHLDSDVPYDVVIYTPEEWSSALCVQTSFANQIKEMGIVLYGEKDS